MKNILVIIFLLFAIITATFAQELRVFALNERLDKVLKRMKVEVSFDSRALSGYKVSVDQTFATPCQAIEFLLAGKPFVCEQIGSVYVISAKKQKLVKKQPVKPQSTIPFVRELAEMKTLAVGEVVITAPAIRYSPQAGNSSAESVMNHRAARYMPGSSDNSVFNLLRMMPGVRASGEPSDELIVWGSAGGESRIVFDGIPLFGMRGFNDNISFINPYLVQEIKLMKGGYGAQYGNQTGAIAEIKGSTPNTIRPSVKATISTLTANVYGSVPVTKHSAVSVAYRRTFYDLYKSELLNPYNGNRANASGKGKGAVEDKQPIEMYVTPKYSFSDININYSGRVFQHDTCRIALYGAEDKFDFLAEPVTGEVIEGKQNSKQIGGSAVYSHHWNKNTQTGISLSYSKLHTIDEQTDALSLDNSVQQLSTKVSHSFIWGKYQKIEAGAELDNYRTDSQTLLKPTIYIADNFHMGNLSFNAGLRADFLSGKVNLQPRLSGSYRITSKLTAMASCGLYNQYLTRLPYKIGKKKYTVAWEVNDKLNAVHVVGGLSYGGLSGFSVTVEGYMKHVNNVVQIEDNEVVVADVDYRGGDLLLKYDFTKGTVYGSYSLSDNKKGTTGHELKLGALTTLKAFAFSANYVYGTGFPVLDYSGTQRQGYGYGAGSSPDITGDSYNRLDIAATYRVRLHEVQLQTGVSLINLFNTHNIKYSYTTVQSKKDPVTLYSKAMTFTPMIFFEILW